MGAFFTNVHVRATPGGEEATRAAILDAVARLVADDGLVACADGEAADRSIVVGPAAGWIGVFDQATESQDVKLLDALAKALSEATACPALAALVHDSDHLLLHLFDGGRLVDEVDRKKKKGAMDRWSGLVAAEAAEAADAVDKLRAAFASRDLFAERTLAEIAGLLGIDAESACAGYGYLVEDPLPEGATHLKLRHAGRPESEESAEGPPRLQSFPAMMSKSIAVGGALRIGYTTHNGGGPARDFYVAVHGSAIDAGVVVVDDVKVTTGLGPQRGGSVFEARTSVRTTKEGSRVLVADFPDGTLPAATLGGARGLSLSTPMDRFMKSNVAVAVTGRAIAPGDGEMFVTLVPRRARDGAGGGGFRIAVALAPRRPLRASSDDPTRYLPLGTPDALVALAVSTLEKDEAAGVAADVVERWSALWPAEAKLRSVVFEGTSAERPSKPRSASLTAGKLGRSPAWKKFRAAFATAGCVGAETKIEPDFGARPRGGDGFGFGGHLVELPLRAEDAEERAAPTLRLVVTLRGRDDVPELVARARALVDDFVARARCCQATLTRCSPDPGVYALDRSLYEDVCGVRGPHTLERGWCKRFLRGVGEDGVWLGPELLGRVDRAALEDICDAAPVGDSLRLVLREGATLDALEAVLAPVLASEQDWKDAAARRAAAIQSATRP